MLTALIPELNFSRFQRAIVVLLAAELLNQRDLFLAANPGAIDEQLSDYSAYVSDGQFYTQDVSKYPLINVWIGNSAPLNDTIVRYHGDHALHFDLFAYRQTEQKENGDIIEATTAADKRLNYLIAQVFHTMGAQVNNWKGAGNLFSSCTYMGWQKMPPEKTPAGVPVIMARMTYSLRTEDLKEILVGWDVEAFTAKIIANNKELTELIITT
jgi:hypothetical protein